MYHQITRHQRLPCMGSNANNGVRRICCGCFSRTMCTGIVALCMALLQSVPRAAVHMGRFPERTWDWGLHNSYMCTQPALKEQHSRGVRLFEIDAYWWLGGTWVVAHIPVVGACSHVKTVEEAVCTLRQLGDNATMMLDIKNVLWPSCGESAVQELVRALGACTKDGTLRVLIDVTCSKYSNVQCARSMRGTVLANTTLFYRGIDFWWVQVQRGEQARGAACNEFTEPDMETANFSRPVLMECVENDDVKNAWLAAGMPTCEQAARVHTVTWLQVLHGAPE